MNIDQEPGKFFRILNLPPWIREMIYDFYFADLEEIPYPPPPSPKHERWRNCCAYVHRRHPTPREIRFELEDEVLEEVGKEIGLTEFSGNSMGKREYESYKNEYNTKFDRDCPPLDPHFCINCDGEDHAPDTIFVNEHGNLEVSLPSLSLAHSTSFIDL
jgi:hypothetical protein